MHVPVARRRVDVRSISVSGMLGMGDNLHQRAIVRQLLQRYEYVSLGTPWPCIYHDLVGPKLLLVPRYTALRTQAKNVTRQAKAFDSVRLSSDAVQLRIWYTGQEVRQHGSILGAMVASAGCDIEAADFRLPVRPEWISGAQEILAKHGYKGDRPLLVYRPLVERTEWQGCRGRNPDAGAYWKIFRAMQEDYFVVSVADLVPNVEWISGMPIRADLELHQGELTFELLAGMFKVADLVYCSAGFAPLLAQAVGTPVICIFGGHESSMTISHGKRFAPTCAIDPIRPCNCFDHNHAHDKTIDVDKAINTVGIFRTCVLR